MQYTNTCPITLEPITKENSFLIKVPAAAEKEHDIYYYVENQETLDKLTFCPLTKRTGNYFVIKLADIENLEETLLQTVSNEKNTLIDDNSALTKIDKENKLTWQSKKFTQAATYQHETNLQDLLAFADNDDTNQEFQASTTAIMFQLHHEPQSNSNPLSFVVIGTQGNSSHVQQQVDTAIAAANTMSPAPVIVILEDNFYDNGSDSANDDAVSTILAHTYIRP